MGAAMDCQYLDRALGYEFMTHLFELHSLCID